MSDGSARLAIELESLEFEVIVLADPGGSGLETIHGSYGATELAASCAPPLFTSCCCPCCCCG